ncbi:MAG: efflux RND transporter periplasmic adaptor subunit [Myxococcaceae bacterium]|nr:MAG: efflux RND transporter periplasmic adaptor subunit [Myxococcaceae bacterium]
MSRVIAFVLFLLPIVACRRDAPAAPPPAPPAARGPDVVELSPTGFANARVETARLAPGAFSPRLAVGGTIQGDPQRVARVGSRIPGRVSALRVALGDQVRRGQALLDIDAVELHETALEQRSAAARARAANEALARQRQLVAERVGAVADLQRAEAEATVANATLRETQEHLRFLGVSGGGGGGEHSIVRSPIDGRVTTLDVAIGQALTGNEDVAVVAQIDAVWAALRLYERDLPRVAVGASVEVRLPGERSRALSGTLTFLSDFSDPVSHTVEARVSLANPDGALRPGMSVAASVALRTPAGGLWLPVEAVQPYGAERVVFVRVGERRFEARNVAVGEEQGGAVPVTAGVAAGDEVAVRGALALRGELERAEMEE